MHEHSSNACHLCAPERSSSQSHPPTPRNHPELSSLAVFLLFFPLPLLVLQQETERNLTHTDLLNALFSQVIPGETKSERKLQGGQQRGSFGSRTTYSLEGGLKLAGEPGRAPQLPNRITDHLGAVSVPRNECRLLLSGRHVFPTASSGCGSLPKKVELFLNVSELLYLNEYFPSGSF